MAQYNQLGHVDGYLVGLQNVIITQMIHKTTFTNHAVTHTFITLGTECALRNLVSAGTQSQLFQ